MRAFRVHTVSGTAEVEAYELPVPEPGPGEIALRVRGAGLNRGEFIVGGVMHGRADKPGGSEAAGEITGIGPGVTGFAIGGRVMGRLLGGGRGGFAEHTVMPAHQAMPVPEHFSWAEAAATPSSYLAAYDAVLTDGRLEAGEWMLVTAASSAAGVAAIQIARAIGARSIGTSGSPDKVEKLKRIGLDQGIVTRRPDFASRVREIAPDGVALAVNCLGGSVFAECLSVLAHRGRLATVGYVDGVESATIDLRQLHANRWVVFGISNSRRTAAQHAETVAGFRRDLLPFMVAGKLTPHIDRTFPFEKLPQAKDYMESNAQIGKIVVVMD